MRQNVNWDLVSKRLRCPQCGEKADIAPETDGTEGFHTHHFKITKAMIESIMTETTHAVYSGEDSKTLCSEVATNVWLTTYLSEVTCISCLDALKAKLQEQNARLDSRRG